MAGYIKRWSVDDILRQLNDAYYICSDPRQDGFIAWDVKQDLYHVKWRLDEILKRCPKFSPEPEFIQEHEQNQLINALSQNYK